MASDNMAVVAAALIFMMYQAWVNTSFKGKGGLRSVPLSFPSLICVVVNMIGQLLTYRMAIGLQFV